MANEQNLRPQNTRTPEERRRVATMGGKASGKKRREKKTLADALRKVLNEPVEKGSRTTKMDAIAIKSIKSLYDNPSMKGLKVLAEILGELKQTINAEGLTLNIQSSDEGKGNIEKIMEGE